MKKHSLIAATLATLSLSAYAATTEERLEQLEIKQKDAVVKGDIPNSFRIPGSETSTRLYGYVGVNLVYEDKKDNRANDFSTAIQSVPLDSSAVRSGRTDLTAEESRFGIETSTPSAYGPVSTKIEGDFAYGNRLRLRHAYGQFGGLVIGQTWTTFMDLENSPETVDFNGPTGSTFNRITQVRYSYGTESSGNFVVALEGANDSIVNTGASSTFRAMPDLVLRWEKSFAWGAMSLRSVNVDHNVTDSTGVQKDVSKSGYGLGLTTLVKMRDGADFLSLALTGGRGMGVNYFNFSNNPIYDGANNKILLEDQWGVVLGYQYKPSGQWRYNFVYGVQNDNSDAEYRNFAKANGLDTGTAGLNKKLEQAHAGVIYNPVKNVDLGAEYILGKRETLAGEEGSLSRINLAARYYFN